MGGEEGLRDLLFSFEGRITRTQYWRAWLTLLVISALLVPAFILFGSIPYLAISLTIVASILMLSANIAVGCKRLHDRGKSGWWLLLFYVAPAVLHAIGEMAGSGAIAFDLASSALMVWMIVELGGLRGTVGPNSYGPDPLAALSGNAEAA